MEHGDEVEPWICSACGVTVGSFTGRGRIDDLPKRPGQQSNPIHLRGISLPDPGDLQHAGPSSLDCRSMDLQRLYRRRCNAIHAMAVFHPPLQGPHALHVSPSSWAPWSRLELEATACNRHDIEYPRARS